MCVCVCVTHVPPGGIRASRHASTLASVSPPSLPLPPLLSLSAQLADEYSLGRRIRTNEGSLESEGGQILELLERERSNLEEKRLAT